ncbi:hypothetical protein AB1398_10800, partial [Hydrogenibacillus schlegelii]
RFGAFGSAVFPIFTKPAGFVLGHSGDEAGCTFLIHMVEYVHGGDKVRRHSRYLMLYHMVWIPKYRQTVLEGPWPIVSRKSCRKRRKNAAGRSSPWR